MEAKKTHMHIFEADEVIPVRKRLRSPVKIHPPLMALIDVMFTLMLFFLVCSSFRTEEGLIASTLPPKGGHEDKAESVPTIDLRIDVRAVGDGAKYTCLFLKPPQSFEDVYDFQSLSGKPNPQASEELFRLLDTYREDNKLSTDTTNIVISPTADVRWQYVVSVYNQAVRARFKKVGFAPQ